MTDIVLWLYNLATPDERRTDKPHQEVAAEIRAILATGPNGLALNEAIGWHLPRVHGYDLVHDRSRPGRANIALYLRTDRKLGRPWWTDLRQTWSRTKHPGQHPPRSILSRRYGALQVTVAHQPPRYTDNVIPAQREGIDALVRIMAPWTRHTWLIRPTTSRRRQRARARIVLMDANRSPLASPREPGPAQLARRIGGTVLARGIDCAVIRNVKGHSAYTTAVNGVHLHSDHRHALIVTLEASR